MDLAHTPCSLSTVSVCLTQMLNEEHTPSSPTAAHNAANTKVTATVGQTRSMLPFVYRNKAGLLICYQDYIYRQRQVLAGKILDLQCLIANCVCNGPQSPGPGLPCRNLPFPDARQLLNLRHDLSDFKLQPLKEQ